jgi:hypothetical protein
MLSLTMHKKRYRKWKIAGEASLGSERLKEFDPTIQDLVVEFSSRA